ncbi:MAG: hypothetical protein ACJAYN_003550 [Bermanella sp.]|jgi:hypothetical protein
MHPEWEYKKEAISTDVTSDNYQALILYAATLSNLQQQTAAEILLHNL